MKKLVFALVATLTVAAVFAADAAKPVRRKTFAEAVYPQTGGTIAVPGAEKGRLVYVNAAKKRVPDKWIESNAEVFRKAMKVRIEVAEGAFEFPSPKIVGSATLFVVDDERYPSLLLAPESRWCLVNVAPLAKGAGEKPAFFAARVQKELTRGFSLLAGAQSSNYPDSLVGCVTKPADLDKFVDCRLPVDVMSRLTRYVEGYGVTPRREVSYRKACQEGWAPQPTNAVQKAIWDKVHAAPTAPIVIKPEPAKKK